MFSGFKALSMQLPDEFLPFINAMNSKNIIYNQVVINWYENGNNYCPYHTDWKF